MKKKIVYLVASVFIATSTVLCVGNKNVSNSLEKKKITFPYNNSFFKAVCKNKTVMDSCYLKKSDLKGKKLKVNVVPSTYSTTNKNDIKIANIAHTKFGTERWALATVDADLEYYGKKSSNGYCDKFDCQLGIKISRKTTPHIWKMLVKSKHDWDALNNQVKAHYNRTRPFMQNSTAFKNLGYSYDNNECHLPGKEFLKTNGSYPSGHTGAAFMNAYVLSKIAPKKKSKLMKRAKQLGNSRVYCNAHWDSDTKEAAYLAKQVFKAEKKTKAFKKELKKAIKEYKKIIKKKKKVTKTYYYVYIEAKKCVDSGKCPNDAMAQATLKALEQLKNWTCAKELAVLKNSWSF